MKYTERRTLSGQGLSKLCIDNDWYTSGTNEEYGKLLQAANDCEDVTTEVIAELAEDIIAHTKRLHPDDMTKVMFYIASICFTFFYWVAE